MNLRQTAALAAVTSGLIALLSVIISWELVLCGLALVALCGYLLAQDSRRRTETSFLVPRDGRRMPPRR